MGVRWCLWKLFVWLADFASYSSFLNPKAKYHSDSVTKQVKNSSIKQILWAYGIFLILTPSFSFCISKWRMNGSLFRKVDWLKCWRKTTIKLRKYFYYIFEISFIEVHICHIQTFLYHQSVTENFLEKYYWWCCFTQIIVKSIQLNSFPPTTFHLNLPHCSELNSIFSTYTSISVRIWSLVDKEWEVFVDLVKFIIIHQV